MKVWVKRVVVTLVVLISVCGLAVFAGAAQEGGDGASGKVTIGIVLPMSGGVANLGEDGLRGVELAIKQANDTGGINGVPVDFALEDDGAVAKVGLSAFQKLITVDKVDVIAGGLFSSVALVGAPLCRENEVAYIAPLSSNPNLTSPGGYIYRLCSSDALNGNVAAKYAYYELGKRKMATLIANTDYGANVQPIIKQRFIELGGQVVAEDKFAQDSTDYRTQLTKIKAANPDVIVIASSHTEGAIILRQMQELGMDRIQVLGMSSMWGDPSFIGLAGSAANGVHYLVDSTAAAGGEEVRSKYVEDFKAMFPDDEVGIISEYMYDAVNILIKAMRESGVTGPEVDEYLGSELKDYPGVTGVVSFTRIGDRVVPVTVRRIENGKYLETGYLDIGD